MERPDHANGIYDTVMEIIVRSNASGFYPGRAGSPPIHFHTDEVLCSYVGNVGNCFWITNLITRDLVEVFSRYDDKAAACKVETA